MSATQYHPDIQSGDINAMDTTPILHPDEMPSAFIPAPLSSSHPTSTLQSHMIHEASPVFSSMIDPNGMIASSIHTSIPEIPSTVFMPSMDAVIPAPPVRAPPPGFLPDLPEPFPIPMTLPMEDPINLQTSHSSPLSSSQSQVPSPSIHGSASSYSTGVTSSLESALDQPTLRSRASTSASPTTLPSSFASISHGNHQTVGMSFSPLEAAVGKQEDGSPMVESSFGVADMLLEIAQTANSARAAYFMQHNAETGNKLGQLKERISQVTQMFEGMMSGPPSVESQDFLSYTPSLPTIPIIDQQEQTPGFPSTFTSPMDVSEHLNVPDQSRKRCASELDEQRTVKALKREPQEDLPLTMVPSESPPVVDTVNFPSSNIPLPKVIPAPLSRPPSPQPSRPPTPPNTFPSHSVFSVAKQSPVTLPYPSFPSSNTSTIDFGKGLQNPIHPMTPAFPGLHSSWSDPVVPTVVPSRHHHSLSVGSATAPHLPSTTTNIMEAFPTPPLQLQSVPTPHPSATTISPPIGRMTRSGSINGTFPSSYGFGYIESFAEPAGPWSSGIGKVSGKLPSTQTWFIGSDGSVPSGSSTVVSDARSTALSTAPSTARNSPGDDEDEDDDTESDNDSTFSKSANHSSTDSSSSTPSVSDIPQEYRTEVDRIFFEYLNKVCSNLDATDSKGEPIHQTLMAKKMQRLDESPDFRPFKFRIQAFTLAFLDELSRQGYPEEKIPMKKVRNYLWRQQYILRFNEDGKKAKSKGNHIWNIEAKKKSDGKWEFRPFHRKLSGTPPSVAYCGLKWSWSPRVWDPQASLQNVPVEYSSPSLPSWLSWKDDVLSGIPPPDAESCRITTNAKFIVDGQESHLSHSFHLTIAPMTAMDTSSFARSRRASFTTDPPRRSTSDSVLFQAVQRAKPRPSTATESPDIQVKRVLQSVAQRVTQEAASQLVSSSPPLQSDFQDLVKQKHVLEQTVDAYDKAISGSNPVQNRRLAVAAQNVVVQAAHTVIADRTVANGGIPVPQAIKSVTVNELSDATQDAIAQAVKREGTGSTEVDIIVAATSILKSRTAGSPPVAVDSSQAAIPQTRSHSTGTAPRVLPNNVYSPPNLPPLSEYV